MVVGVALNEPLTQRHELNWLLLLVEGQTLARDGVVSISALFTATIATWFEVIWVILVFADQIGENGFFLASCVEEELDVLIELAPLLWLLRLVLVLFAEVVHDDWGLGLSLRLATGS